MTATYSLTKAELNADFIESIKKTFKTNRITILVEEELDETEMILADAERLKRLDKSIAQLRAGNVVKIDLDKILIENGL
ncbi:MAG: hypothetical protein EAZ15_08825 [Sphingobacteriales bacterium]|nr:MAG: hypothetical protein EAZ15_08825 [Sphingobacteriales bacterium]